MVDEAEDDQKESFLTVLLRQDELGAVVRAQIYIEHVLIEYVNSRPQPPKTSGLSFAQLVKLTLDLGLPQRFNHPLRAFSRIRNQFAHSLDTKLTDDLVKVFCQSFNKQMRREANDGINRVHFLGYGDGRPTREVITPRGLFIMYSYSLWFALGEAVKTAGAMKAHDGDEDC
jgi:hypothetical protein